MRKPTGEEGTSSRCLPCRFITAALSDQSLNGLSAAYSICLTNVNYMI